MAKPIYVNRRQEHIDKLKKQASLERLFNKHNRKMEFLRTLFGAITIGLQVIILLKLFGMI